MCSTQFNVDMDLSEVDKRQQVYDNIDNVIAYLYRIKSVLTTATTYENLSKHMELQNQMLTRRMMSIPCSKVEIGVTFE